MRLSEKSKDKWEEYVPEGGGDDGKSIVRDNFIYLPVIPFLCPPRDSFRFDVTGRVWTVSVGGPMLTLLFQFPSQWTVPEEMGCCYLSYD